MNRFSPSVFFDALVIIFVTLHLLVAFTDETLHSFSHNEVQSEHHHSENQGSTITQSNKRAPDRQGARSRTSRNIAPYLRAPLNPDASVYLSDHIVCLSSVILRI
jgi:hypothetical protein